MVRIPYINNGSSMHGIALSTNSSVRPEQPAKHQAANIVRIPVP